jgi:serine/threonine protein kinase
MQASPAPSTSLPRTSSDGEGAGARLVAGQVIGGAYVLVEPLGSGGMGQVWRARDERLDRPVALKVLTAVDEEARARFLREARALGRIEHAHVVRVFASGDDGGVVWMALEVIGGEPLSELVGGGPIDEETALLLGAQIARGLAVVHAHGVVHRDVKPSNILVDDDANVKLIDFGVASLTGAHGGFTTRAGIVVGTPHFMSPEQARGSAVDARADAWGLGATLYTLLTGHPPFFRADDEPDLEILARLLRDDVVDVAERAEVSPETAALVHELLSRDVAVRPDDLAVVAARLEALARGLGRGQSPVPDDQATVDGAPRQKAPRPDTLPGEATPASSSSSSPSPSLSSSVSLSPTASVGPSTRAARVPWGLLVVVVAVVAGVGVGQALAPPKERIVERVVEVPVQVPVEVSAPARLASPAAPSVDGAPVSVTTDGHEGVDLPLHPSLAQAEVDAWTRALVQRPMDDQEQVVRDLVAAGAAAVPALSTLVAVSKPIGAYALQETSKLSWSVQDQIMANALGQASTPRLRARRIVEMLGARRNDTALVLLRETAERHRDPLVRAAAAEAADSIFRVNDVGP